MNQETKVGTVVTIGDTYAERMDYEHAKGSTAVITDRQTSVATVVIIGGDAIGNHIDVHTEDLLVEEYASEKRYHGFIDRIRGVIYYTEIEEHASVAFHIVRPSFTTAFANEQDMSRILDVCEENYKPAKAYRANGWTMVHIETSTHPNAISIRNAIEEITMGDEASRETSDESA